MGRFGLYIGAVVLAAAATDFACNSPVGGYVAKKIRETIQRDQPDNVRVGYKFGNTVLSDRTVGRIADGTLFAIEATMLGAGWASGRYKRKRRLHNR